MMGMVCFLYSGLDRGNIFTGQGFLNASVHALGGKRFGTFGQCLGGGFNLGGIFQVTGLLNSGHQDIDLCTLSR